VEELDEFPDDVCQAVTDLLQTWRKGEQFPTTLAEARQKVEEIEQIFKTKVGILNRNELIFVSKLLRLKKF
jgi:hypothetical protein